jgi:TPR repeat protein
MLWQGAEDEPDEQEAVKWWLKAAAQNYRPAQVDLAYACVAKTSESFGSSQTQHSYRMGYGAKKELSEAERWYRKAGDAGNKDGQYGMGWMYWRGPAVPRDDAVRGEPLFGASLISS